MKVPDDKMETLCIHAGYDPSELTHKEVQPHISLSTCFAKYVDPESPVSLIVILLSIYLKILCG